MYNVNVKAKSPYIGKYVCFGLPDGSFSWGRIKEEGVVNTPDGEKEVFILTERMTCRVPQGDLERSSVKAISRRIGAGTAGPMAIPGRTDPKTLPSYQQGGYKALPEKTEDKKPENTALPVKANSALAPVPESAGVPELSEVMNIQKSEGLRMSQKVGSVMSSVDPGRKIDFIFRRYGYDTNVRKDQLNLDDGGDIIDRKVLGLEDLTDDELFLVVMRGKVSGIGLNQGAQNMLALGFSTDGKQVSVDKQAANILKERKGIKVE